jgi:hypothetical protein
MPSEDPSPLTLDEHRELAVELRRTRARMRELCNMVVGVYGPDSPAASGFLKTSDSMDRLFNYMQAQVARDYPGMAVPELYS